MTKKEQKENQISALFKQSDSVIKENPLTTEELKEVGAKLLSIENIESLNSLRADFAKYNAIYNK